MVIICRKRKCPKEQRKKTTSDSITACVAMGEIEIGANISIPFNDSAQQRGSQVPEMAQLNDFNENEAANDCGPLDCSTLLIELTQGPDFNATQTREDASQNMGVPEEPHIIFETQTWQDVEDVAVEKPAANQSWDKSRLGLMTFFLKPYFDKEILTAGKDNIKLKILDWTSTGSLVAKGWIETNGSVFKSIGEWIKSLMNRRFTKLKAHEKRTLTVEYNGKCLYELLRSEPTSLKNSVQNTQTQMGHQRMDVIKAKPTCERELTDTIPNTQKGDLRMEVVEANPTCERELTDTIPNTQKGDLRMDVVEANPSCERELITGNNVVKNLGPKSQSQSLELGVLRLVPDTMTRHLTNIFTHPPSEFYRTCQCIEEFWKKGCFPKHLMEEVDQW